MLVWSIYVCVQVYNSMGVNISSAVGTDGVAFIYGWVGVVSRSISIGCGVTLLCFRGPYKQSLARLDTCHLAQVCNTFAQIISCQERVPCSDRHLQRDCRLDSSSTGHWRHLFAVFCNGHKNLHRASSRLLTVGLVHCLYVHSCVGASLLAVYASLP
jgi:hypothetical protein